MLPPRQYKKQRPIKRRIKPRRSKAIKCRPHINWVLENYCCAFAGRGNKRTGRIHECEGRLDPHHTPTRGAGGGDDNVAPLCRTAHALLDSHGNSEKSVQDEYGVDLREMAAELWEISPAGRKYRLQNPPPEDGR